ncbi:MAG: DUF4194 domain-containing protein [Deltaproteobacteria bacterium]|nr:DUF4194 domain-containing protein [Deltaproteobacteria bacterium]
MSDARADLAPEVFLAEFPRLDDRGRRLFAEVIQALQLRCYVLRGGALRVDPGYRFIEKHEELVNAYLSLGGWRLHLDRERGVARLYHPESSGRARFNKVETTLILALRIFYHEQKQIVSESIETVVSVGALREKLHSLLPAQAVRPFLSRKTLGSVFRRLEKFGIVSFVGSSLLINDETRLRIEPVLEHLVSSQSADEIGQRLKELYEGTAGAEVGEAGGGDEALEAEIIQ